MSIRSIVIGAKALSPKTISKLYQAAKYVRPSYYSGPDYYGTIAVLGRSRDSDILEECNFATALKILGGEGKGVSVIRDGHWAVGWVETLRVKTTSSKFRLACAIVAALDRYPVLDDGAFSEAEHDERVRIAEESQDSIATILERECRLKSVNQDDLKALAYWMAMEYLYDNGLDSSLYDNQYHPLDIQDIEGYIESLNSVIENSCPCPIIDLASTCLEAIKDNLTILIQESENEN